MNELMHRFRAQPWLSAELIFCSLLIYSLGLASSLYVIQVLNRYLAYGVNATLITLTTGVVIAIVFEYVFRRLRFGLASKLSQKRNVELFFGLFNSVSSIQPLLRSKMHLSRPKLMRHVESIESGYSPGQITLLLDLPLTPICIMVVLVISPLLGCITCALTIVVWFVGWLYQGFIYGESIKLAKPSLNPQAILDECCEQASSLVLYSGHRHLAQRWRGSILVYLGLKDSISLYQGLMQSALQSAQTLLSVCIYGCGAMLVVQGELNVGALIGVNILAARALGPMSRFAFMRASFLSAQHSTDYIQAFDKYPKWPALGVTFKKLHGHLQCQNLSYSYTPPPQPLHNQLNTESHPLILKDVNFEVKPGEVMLVKGVAGAGKTTLVHLLAGLLVPQHGCIMIDDVPLMQLDVSWLHQQLVLVPQNPYFPNVTYREAILGQQIEQDGSRERLQQVIAEVGLKRLMDRSTHGVCTQIVDNGRLMSTGDRKLLAFARALVVDGPLVILDEPTEGLDYEDRVSVYRLLMTLSRQSKTIIIISDDPMLLKVTKNILNLTKSTS